VQPAGGRRFVPILAGFAGLALAAFVGFGFAPIDAGVDGLSYGVVQSGTIGLFVYGVLNRLLIVTGLHHILNNIAWFIIGDFNGATGDLKRFFAGDKSAGAFMAGFFPPLLLGLNLWLLLSIARDLGLGVGVAFNPETSVEYAVGASIGADLVLCMSIHPGYSGQEFMPEAYDRIRTVRSVLPPEVHVQVDGGIGPENIKAVRDAGASLFVAGSSIFGREDLPRAYRRLVQELA